MDPAAKYAFCQWKGVFFFPLFFISVLTCFVLKITFLGDSFLSPLTLPFLPQSAGWQADQCRDRRCPLRVRQHFLSVPEARSASISGRPELAPFSVCEVHLLCSVTPLTTPISAAPGLCKLELTTPPHLLKICTTDMPQRLTTLQLHGFSSPSLSRQKYRQKKKKKNEHFFCKTWLKSSHSFKPLRDYKRDVMGKTATI